MSTRPYPHTVYVVIPVGRSTAAVTYPNATALVDDLNPLEAHVIDEPALCHTLTRYLIRTMAAERRRLIDQEAP